MENKYKTLTAFTQPFSIYLLTFLHYLMVAKENDSSMQWFRFLDEISWSMVSARVAKRMVF